MLSICRLFVGFDFAETLYVHWLRNNPCYFDCDDLKGPCLFEFLWKKPLILNEMSAYFFFFNYLMMLPIVLLLILNIQINFIVLLLFLFNKIKPDKEATNGEHRNKIRSEIRDDPKVKKDSQ